MSDFVSIAPEDLPAEGEGASVQVGKHDVALFKVDGQYRALENECPHAGAQFHDGYIEGDVVSCPFHCWQFDTSSGKCLTVEGADVARFEVRVEDGAVSIALPPATSPAPSP